jgi:glycosyltransferase involved in cell wall biosynthesis
MQGSVRKLSIIVPIHNEESCITRLYAELKTAMENIRVQYEIVCVDDGSTDKSLDILKAIALQDTAVKLIAFPRNYGQTAALVSGKDFASGEVVVFMDGDLQNDPKDIPILVKKIEEGYDVVSGWRRQRKDAFLNRRLPSKIANKVISWVSGIHLHDYGCTLKAYRAEILKDVKLYGEMHRFIPIYAAWAGAKITEVVVSHRPRTSGRSKYGLWRTFKVLLDLVTVKFLYSYQTKPIYVFGGTGIVLFFLSLVFVGMLLYNKFFHGISMIQSPLLLLSALFVIIGVQFILIGLLAEMQIRAYFESLHKPIYHIREKVNL